MKKHNQILLVSLAVTFCLIIGLLIYRNFQPAGLLFCSSSVPRGGDLEKWLKIIDPNLPVDKIDEDYFNKFTISSDSEKYTINYPNKEPRPNPFAFELREMSPGEPLKIGSGTLQLSVIGIDYPDANQGKEKSIDIRFYDDQLQSMSEERIIELENRYIIQYRKKPPSLLLQYPKAMFIFEHKDIENVMFHNFWVFDSRTHQQLTTGGGSSNRENLWEYQINIPLWHNAPVDVVFDVSFGPTKTFEFPPVAGEGFATDNFECRLFKVFEGVNTSWYSNNELYKASPPESSQKFYFICQPQAIYMPVTFEILDKDGNKLKTWGGGAGTYTHMFDLMEPLEKASVVRAEYRTKRYRIVLHLPYFPGMPRKNQNIDNILDNYIPYASFQLPVNIQQFLQKVLQFDNFQISGIAPPDKIDNLPFPMEFSDVTVRDIAKVYSRGGTLNVDIENNKLEMQYPVPLKEKIRQFVNKIMRRK